MKSLWALVKWNGRLLLWVTIWPLGLWRSWRHGRQKRHDAVVAELRKLRHS